MDADELRERLFVSFSSTGVLGSIKSQLRAALLEQLRKQDDLLFKSASPKGRPSLQERLLKSIFIEYLGIRGYTFTLSVFIPESQMEEWPPFSHEELMQILRLDLAAPKDPRQDCSIAEKILALVQLPVRLANTADISTQTEETGTRKLDVSLKEIDDACLRKMDLERCSYPSQTAEHRMSILYQEFDKRVRDEVDSQVARIRDFELERVRMEEAAHHRRQLTAARKDLEDMQKTRFELLSKREESFMERMLQKQKEVEFLAYQQRQKVLEDTEKLQAREAQFKSESEAQEKAIREREEKIQMKETQLKMQEEDVNHLRDFLHSQAEEILSMKKSQLEKEYQSLRKQLGVERALFEAERNQLRDDKQAFTAEASSARSDKELVQALYRRLSAEEAQKKSLLIKINEVVVIPDGDVSSWKPGKLTVTEPNILWKRLTEYAAYRTGTILRVTGGATALGRR